MSHPNLVKIKRIVIESPPDATISPFLGVSLRQLSKETGLDHAYLGRVKNGQIPVTIERYKELCKAWERLSVVDLPPSPNREEDV